MKSILSLFSVLLSPQPFFFLLWNAYNPYFLCSVPICKLVSASIRATKRNVCICTAWHVAYESEKIVNGVTWFLVSCTMVLTYWLMFSDKPRVFVLYMENDYDNSSNKILSFSTIRFVKSSYELQFFGIAKAYNDKEPK